MSTLLETLSSNLDADTLAKLSQQVGISPSQTQSALASALPMLVTGLAKNASTTQGAQSLASALERDHDGSLLDNLGSLLGQSSGGESGLGGLLGVAASFLGGSPGPSSARTVDGAGILGHILGGAQPQVQQGVAKASGLDAGKVAQLLALAAPLVMGALGKAKQNQGLDAGGLANMLNQEQRQIAGDKGSVLTSLIDSDGDGDVSDELASFGLDAGKKLLGSLFK